MPAKNISIYQIKITLRDTRPPIWRRVQVTNDISLIVLHKIIQVVMGWQDYHLHIFTINEQIYGDPADDEYGDLSTIDEANVQLRQVVPGEGFRFHYEYDFGDSWEHTLLVEKILPVEAGVQYPRCLKGKRACPPEDVGGVWGYETLLEAIQDPDDPEYNDYIEWLGADFDPEAFDLKAVNQRLANLKPSKRHPSSDWESGEGLPEINEENLARYRAAFQELVKPEYLQTAEQLPLRQDFVAFLNYLTQNKVTGTQATGNLPRKAIRELAALFVTRVELEKTIGDAVFRFQNENDVGPIHFIHLLAAQSGMVSGGKSKRWSLTASGVDFLNLDPILQVWMLFSAWWLAMDWQAVNNRYNFDEDMIEVFNSASFTLLLELPVDQSTDLDGFAEQVFETAGLHYNSNQPDLVQFLMSASVYSLLIKPLIQFSALKAITSAEIADYAGQPKVTAFQKTSFGEALLVAIEDFFDTMSDTGEEMPEPTEPQSVEEAYQDILQNIEFSIIQVYRANPALTDYEVDRAIELLQRAYQGEATGKTPALPTSPLSQQVYHSAREMCEFRLGRAALTAQTRKLGMIKVQPAPVDVIIDCLKRIRKSIQMWTKEGGRQGYLKYIDPFL